MRVDGQVELLRSVAEHIPDFTAVYSVHDAAEGTISWGHRQELLEYVEDGECEYFFPAAFTLSSINDYSMPALQSLGLPRSRSRFLKSRIGVGRADVQIYLTTTSSTSPSEAGQASAALLHHSVHLLPGFPPPPPPLEPSYHPIEPVWTPAPIPPLYLCTVSYPSGTRTTAPSRPFSAYPRPASKRISSVYRPNSIRTTYPKSPGKRKWKISCSGEEVIPESTFREIHPGGKVIGFG
jgi:hypothetical protein